MQSPQGARRPPVPLAEELHQRWYEQAADHGGVDQHRERGAEAEFLDEDQLRGHERTDRDGEQERGGGHDPPGAFEADRDSLVVGDAAVIGLFDPTEPLRARIEDAIGPS